MAETSDSHQNRPRISVEDWLAATESEYQETARQVGELREEIRAQTTWALWLLSFALAVLGVAAVLFEVSLRSPDGWELGAILPIVIFGVAPGFYFLFEPSNFKQYSFLWDEIYQGHEYIAEKKLSIARTDQALNAFSAIKRDKIFTVWKWLWLLSSLWGITVLALA